ncbi:MAG: VCBS repeat-containing protein [Planctomycetaceae bacterium]
MAADIDADGLLDLYVGNDVMMNFLYHNVDGRRFEDLSVSSGAGVSERGTPDASMGVQVTDYDNDGQFDLWATNFQMESFAIYRNQGHGLFRHMSTPEGIAAIGDQSVGWGTVFPTLISMAIRTSQSAADTSVSPSAHHDGAADGRAGEFRWIRFHGCHSFRRGCSDRTSSWTRPGVDGLEWRWAHRSDLLRHSGTRDAASK